MQDFGAQIVDNLPEPVFVFCGRTFGLIKMNPAAETWLRKPRSAVLNAPPSVLFPAFGALEEQVKACVRSQKRYNGYDIPLSLNGSDFVCQYKVFAINENVAVLMSVRKAGAGFSDTDSQTQTVLMLGKMLAHELKNPLAGIRGAAQLLESELTGEDNLELTALIKTEVDRIGRLASRMETFGQAEDLEFKPMNIHAVLRNAGLLFQSKIASNILISEIYDPSLPQVRGDADGLMQVFVNLISNAVDAIEYSGQSGGEIQIVTGYRAGVRKREPGSNELQSGPMLPIEVKIIDNGPGIPGQLRERIFQPFVTGKANGQGLGLSLVSKIVDEHQGLIDVVSEAGRTVFTVLLPAEES